MGDRKWIYLGLAIFLVVILFPVWFKALAGTGVGTPRPDLELPEGECIRPVEEMRADHMTILDEWRAGHEEVALNIKHTRTCEYKTTETIARRDVILCWYISDQQEKR